MMLKLLLSALLAVVMPSSAQNWQQNSAVKFGGISVLNDSSQIDIEDTPDAQNVITDNKGLEKRPGNVRIAQILNGFAVKFVGDFVAPSATRYLIAHASNTVYQSNLSGSPVALSTVSAGANISMISAYGKAIFQDGIGNPWSWDGTSTATVSGMPIGKYILFADERVYVANVPNASASQVSVSSFGSTSYFTVPPNVSSVGDGPNSFTFQKDDGEGITCAKVTPWGKVFGKRHSMWILKGYDNLTFYKRNIDPKIGCVDDRAMQMVDGLLVWLAVDAIWAWPGSGPPQMISRDILPLLAAIRQVNAAAAQWIVDTQGDFQSGTRTTDGPTPAWDWSSTPGSIIPSSATYRDDGNGGWNTPQLFVGFSTVSVNSAGARVLMPVQAGTGTFVNAGAESNSTTIDWTPITQINAGVWSVDATPNGTPYGSNAWISNTSNANNHYSLNIYVLDRSSNVLTSTTIDYPSTSGGCIIAGLTQSYLDLSTFTAAMVMIRATYGQAAGGGSPCASSIAGQSPPYYGDAGGCNADMVSYPFVRPQALAIKTGQRGTCQNIQAAFDIDESTLTLKGTLIARAYDTLMSTPVYGPFAVNMTSAADSAVTFKTYVATSASGAWDAAQTATPDAQLLSKARRAIYYTASYTLSSTTKTFEVDSVQEVAIATGAYYSPVDFVGNAITVWGTMNFTDFQASPPELNYYIRSATYSFAANDTSPGWTVQPNNTTIVVATGPYLQWYVDTSSVTSSSMTASLARAAANWQEGTTILMGSGVLNHRFFLCAEFSASATANDKCIMLQKNNEWIFWAGPIPSAMGRYNDQLLVGDGSSNSYVWKIMQDGVYQDDGSPINAYWVSRDFTLDKPFQQKILHETWIDGVPAAGSTLVVGYAVDKSTSYFSKTIDLGAQGNIVSKRIPYSAGYALGKYMKFKFSNAIIDQYFNINNYMYRTETKDIVNE